MQDIDFTTGTSVAIFNPSAAKSVVTHSIVKSEYRKSAIKRFFCVCASMADDTWASNPGIAIDIHAMMLPMCSSATIQNIDLADLNRVESMKYLKSNQDAILLGFGAICAICSLFIPTPPQPLLMACGVSL